jgi:cellulose synthase/poly-beta-1,6-N-acetylglucosamine synthase-like glycosyltransferase
VAFTQLAVTAATLYLLGWAVRRLLGTSRPRFEPGHPLPRIAIVIPAHDEEIALPGTLAAVRRLDYPREALSVVVVADNCSDATADVARAAGVQCFERRDAARRGKGHALRFAIDRLIDQPLDALVFLDADSAPDADLLQRLCGRLAAGQRVLQAASRVANPDASALTYLLHVGNCMENDLFHEPKAAAGLPTFLRGVGMCFGVEVLREHPWSAYSITEDTEYGLALLEQGVRTEFAPEATVRSTYPESLEQLRMQRTRWAAGSTALTRRRAVHLVGSGLARRHLARFDAGLSLLFDSKPLVLGTWLIGTLGAGALVALGGSPLWLAWSAGLGLALLLYLLAAVAVAGVDRRRAMMLARLPLLALWMIGITVAGLLGHGGRKWARTKRS